MKMGPGSRLTTCRDELRRGYGEEAGVAIEGPGWREEAGVAIEGRVDGVDDHAPFQTASQVARFQLLNQTTHTREVHDVR